MEKEQLSADADLFALNREDALICLMKKYGEEIKRLVFTFIKSWPQAEDITQDFFITLYTNWIRFEVKLLSAARSTRLLLINQKNI